MIGNSKSRKFRFSKRAIENLRYPKELKGRQAEFSDTDTTGLRIFLTRLGKVSFAYRYTIFKRKRCIGIGPWPAVSVSAARERCWELRAMVARGEDPLVEKERQQNALTFKEYSVIYLEHSKRVNKAWRHYERMIANLNKILGRYLLSALTKHDIQKLLDDMIARGLKGSTVNRTRSLLLRMLNLAVEWSYLESNPAKGIQKHPESPGREVFLTVEQSRCLMEALDQIEPPFRVSACAVKFLMLTGKRLSESMRLRWNDVDMENKVAFLRLETTKGKRADRLFLSDAAIEVLEELKTLKKPDNPHLFPGLKPGARLTSPKKVFATAKRWAGIDQSVRLHDLRHTYASQLLANGASLWEIKTLLSHRDLSTTQRYLHMTTDNLQKRTNEIGNSLKETV